MYKKNFVAVAVTLMFGFSALHASAQKDPMVGGAAMYPTKNIVENAVNSKDHTTLVAAVKAAGLVDTLEGPGPFTVFAPTNEAFDKLPAGTVDTLLKPENLDQLKKILTYHVVAGKMTSKDIAKAIKAGGGKAVLTTVEGGKLTAMMNAGKLVSDDILLGMLEERLSQDDVKNGFILDGYPRNLAQADALDHLLVKIGQPLDAVVKLNVPNEVIIARCEIRFKAEHRHDDDPEVVRDRLKIYAEQTAPVADFFARRGKLQVVEGVGELDEVTERVKRALSSNTAAAHG